jgi:hypothetical protein
MSILRYSYHTTFSKPVIPSKAADLHFLGVGKLQISRFARNNKFEEDHLREPWLNNRARFH